jgi:hypothetical protein
VIELGRGMVFPDSYAVDQPDGPGTVACPVCGEDRWEADEPCEHCGHEWDREDPVTRDEGVTRFVNPARIVQHTEGPVSRTSPAAAGLVARRDRLRGVTPGVDVRPDRETVYRLAAGGPGPFKELAQLDLRQQGVIAQGVAGQRGRVRVMIQVRPGVWKERGRG